MFYNHDTDVARFDTASLPAIGIERPSFAETRAKIALMAAGFVSVATTNA